jgi:hypothetical protein
MSETNVIKNERSGQIMEPETESSIQNPKSKIQNTFHWPLSSDFRPHLLLPGGHLQTLYAALGSRTSIPYRAKQHVIAVSHGDQLVLHEDRPDSWRPGGLCAVLIHGLCGCHGSPYMVRMAHKLSEKNVCVFRMDMRGCGAGFRLAQKPGHAGRSEDVQAVVDFITNYCPDSPLVLLGVSLGGNLLLKLLGEWGSQAPSHVLRAMAVAPPVDLVACSDAISRSRMFAYNRWFVRVLIQQVRTRSQFAAELAQIPLSPPPKTLFQFDDRITARLSGFSCANEYYRLSSSMPLLPEIHVPTVILSSADDPVVPVAILHRARLSPSVHLHITKSGGHVGFFGRAGSDPDRNWLDWRAVEFVTSARTML